VRRQVAGSVGQYVDVIVALYPLENATPDPARAPTGVRTCAVNWQRAAPADLVAAGIKPSREWLSALREAYREAKDAVSISMNWVIGNKPRSYGDLKLFPTAAGA